MVRNAWWRCWPAQRTAVVSGAEDCWRLAPPGVRHDNRRTLAALAGSGITCPPVDAALLATYFSYLEAHRHRAGSWRPDIDLSAPASDRRGPVPAGTTERLRGHRGPRFTGGRRAFTAP